MLIEFPGVKEARAWYHSPAYREILRLRADHLVGDLLLVDGCGDDHDSAEFAAGLRALSSTSV